MSEYTRNLEGEMEDDTDTDYLGHLMKVLKTFRTRQQSLDAFIKKHGYTGDIADTEEKTGFIRKKFKENHIDIPRSLKEWYKGKPFKRPSAYALCFAFELDLEETE